MGQTIHFITGKGGVGKSLMAAGLALREARAGKTTLLVELGERSFYKDFFSLPTVGYKATPLAPNLDVALWTAADCLREYATSLIKVESLTKLFFENSVSRNLIEIAPGLSELAILGKATSGPRHYGPSDQHQSIVIDAPATGHFLSLLKAPRAMADTIKFGPMGEQSRSIDTTLRNPEICKIHVVSLSEDMPVQETEELVAALKNDLKLNPSIIMNKSIAIPEGLENSANAFAEFLEKAKQRQDTSRERLKKLSDNFCEVPWFFNEDPVELQAATAGALR